MSMVVSLHKIIEKRTKSYDTSSTFMLQYFLDISGQICINMYISYINPLKIRKINKLKKTILSLRPQNLSFKTEALAFYVCAQRLKDSLSQDIDVVVVKPSETV